MEQTALSGFVCSRDERIMRKYIVPFGLLCLSVFSCILWYEALNQKNELLPWIFAAVFFALVIGMLLSHLNAREIDDLQFVIREDCVSNSSKKRTLSIKLHEPVFLTSLSLAFAYGKATQTRRFYLLSNKPFDPNCIKGGGLFVIKHLLAHEIVTLPNTNETTLWIEHKWNITAVPSYPKIACMPQRQQDSFMP